MLSLDEIAGREINNLQKEGGISITHNGLKGGLLARGMLFKSQLGYSDVIEFSDPEKSKSNKLDGVGLRFGEIDGQNLEQGIVVRNIGDTRVRFKGIFSYQKENNSGTRDLTQVWLDAGEVKEIRIPGINSSNSRDILTAGLHFEHTGKAGQVIASAVSISSDGNNVFRVPFKDAELHSSIGIYPFSLEDDAEPIVYIQNVTDTQRKYMMHIDFGNGTYVLGVNEIGANQVKSFDLRKIRDEQIPDMNGNVLPLDLTGGKARWSLYGRGKNSLIGRIEQANLSGGMSSTSACGACCSYSFYGSFLSPGTVTGGIGGTTPFLANEVLIDCFGTVMPAIGVNYASTFSSSNPSVATINSSGVATGEGIGTTTISAQFDSVIYTNCGGEDAGEGICCDEEEITTTCTAYCDVVAPVIDELSPEEDVVGDAPTITIVGENFVSGATVNVSGSGVTVSNVTFVDSEEITAKFTIAKDATGGNRAVTVTQSGVQSNSKNFQVQIPTKAKREDIQALVVIDPGPGTLKDYWNQTLPNGTNKCGAYRNVKYQLIDQDGDDIISEDLLVTEVLSNFTSTPTGITPPTPNSVLTNNVGVFGDHISVVETHPSCPPTFSFTQIQKFKVTAGTNKDYNLTTENNMAVSKNSSGQWAISVTINTP